MRQDESDEDARDDYNGVSGRVWRLRNVENNQECIDEIAEKYNISYIIARILHNRGINIHDIEDFLNPDLKKFMQTAHTLKGMREAVDYVYKSVIIGQKKAIICGDYDADGITSTSLLYRYFQDIKCNAVDTYIPNRIDDGYGPSVKLFDKFKSEGYDCCILVDCGTVAYGPIDHATNTLGLDVIVIDHHRGGKDLPDALSVINPNRIDEQDSKYKNIAAVAVCFLFVNSMHLKLNDEKYLDEKNIVDIDIMKYMDLVALGSICDVMPVMGINRAFLSIGMECIRRGNNIGIRTIFEVMRITTAPNSRHLSYTIGPRINACGRVGDSNLGVSLLCSNDAEDVQKIAEKIEEYNAKRKSLENDAMICAKRELQHVCKNDKYMISKTLLWLALDSHPGVIGILANRYKEKYGILTLIVIDNKDGTSKASARSVEGVDISYAILEARKREIIIEGGGHPMAAGFSVYNDKISEVKEFLHEFVQKSNVKKSRYNIRKIDGKISVRDINEELWKKILKLSPFGLKNEEPIFVITAYIEKVEIFGACNEHLYCILGDPRRNDGKFCKIESIASIKAIVFRCREDIRETLKKYEEGIVNVIGHVNVHQRRTSNNMEFIIEDVAEIANQ